MRLTLFVLIYLISHAGTSDPKIPDCQGERNLVVQYNSTCTSLPYKTTASTRVYDEQQEWFFFPRQQLRNRYILYEHLPVLVQVLILHLYKYCTSKYCTVHAHVQIHVPGTVRTAVLTIGAWKSGIVETGEGQIATVTSNSFWLAARRSTSTSTCAFTSTVQVLYQVLNCTSCTCTALTVALLVPEKIRGRMNSAGRAIHRLQVVQYKYKYKYFFSSDRKPPPFLAV